MLAAAAFALIGFPLDDVWHRIFGQDVTLWGPTHLMLIGGAGLTLIGSAILIVEGRGDEVERPETPRRRARSPTAWSPRIARYRRAFAIGGLLIGLSTFQAEFDFGVPQFQLVLEPIMLAFAAGVALVAARVWIGPGARARRRALLRRRPRRDRADRRRRSSARRRRTCRSTSPRRSASRARRWSISPRRGYAFGAVVRAC